MQTIELSVELVNQILGYLGTRPYQEVFPLIYAIQTSAQPAVEETIPAE
jgi:hypothetical protein